MDVPISEIIKDTLDYLRQIAKTTPSLLCTREEATYFASHPLKPKTKKIKPPEARPSGASQKFAPSGPCQNLALESIEEGGSIHSIQSPSSIAQPRDFSSSSTSNELLGSTTSPNVVFSADPGISPPPQPISPKPAKIIEEVEHLEPKPASPLKPPPKIEKNNWGDIRQIVEKTFPHFALRETIPDDAHAKKMSRLWEETYLSAQIVVIAFGEVGPGLNFLKNVTQAIHTLIAPAQLIEGATFEKEKGWDFLLNSPTLKYVISSPWSSWKSTSLNAHYRQNGSTQEQFLGSQKLLLLEPSFIYLKNPEQKRKLWQLISTQLSL
jgi:hypothetical protein